MPSICSTLKDAVLRRKSLCDIHVYKGHKVAEVLNWLMKELKWKNEVYLRAGEFGEHKWQEGTIVEEEKSMLRGRYSHKCLKTENERLQISYVYVESGVQFNCKSVGEDAYLTFRAPYETYINKTGDLDKMDQLVDEIWDAFESKINVPAAAENK